MSSQISKTSIFSNKLYLKNLRALVIFMYQIFTHNSQAFPIINTTTCDESSKSHQQNIISSYITHCNSSSSSSSSCNTFAILRTNSKFSSISNLSSFLGIDRFSIAEANGISPTTTTKILPKNRLLLIPIFCECDGVSKLFRSLSIKIITLTSFSTIVESLQGLTTCKAISDQNNNNNNLIQSTIPIPIPCSCNNNNNILITYPVVQGDTVSSIARKFNTTKEAIISTNSLYNTREILSFSSILVPVSSNYKPNNLRRKKMRKRIGVFAAIIGVLAGIAIAISISYLLMKKKKKEKKKSNIIVNGVVSDLELQQLSLSVRTTSDKKVSFEDSNNTPRNKAMVSLAAIVESFTVDEILRATENLNTGNLIEGSVFHGRLNGQNVAVKRLAKGEINGGIDFTFFNDLGVHRHPNILRLLGTCLNTETTDSSYLVFEYAMNGSFKDWLHGGLAIKSQFIASCDCFLTWIQRLRICHDTATALRYMHYVTEPRRVHGNLNTSNIFLDEDFNAKLGGLALISSSDSIDESDIAKDVFSLGVVILEALSGRPVETGPEREVRRVLETGVNSLRDWIDEALFGRESSYSLETAIEVANLGRDCTEDDVALRPNIDDVADRLAGILRKCSGGGECSSLLVSESSTKPLVKPVSNNSSNNNIL